MFFFKAILSLVLTISLYADGNTTNSVDKLFVFFGIDKAQQEKIIKQTKILSREFLDKSKEYSIQGKNILIEQTLQNGINALVDTTKIKVEKFDINDTTNDIKMEIFLNGEDDILDVDIKSFEWGVSADNKYIVFENVDISLNIPWVDYVIQNMIKRGDGYIKVPKNVTLFSLLFSIKPNIESTYKETKKEPFDIVNYPYDKSYIDIDKFEVSKKNIDASIVLNGSKDGLKFKIKSYNLLRANKKTLIVLKNIKFESCNKPWFQSVIEKQNNQIHLTYTDELYKLLAR